MKLIIGACLLIPLLFQLATPAPSAAPPTTTPAHNIALLEQKILGFWQGPSCGGDYTFNPDGTFVMENFTPGQNTLTGTWSIRWDALPPTLLVTCKTSDFRTKVPDRAEYESLGKTREFKLLELNDQSLTYRWGGDKDIIQFHRREIE
jgi:hypothetical protein